MLTAVNYFCSQLITLSASISRTNTLICLQPWNISDIPVCIIIAANWLKMLILPAHQYSTIPSPLSVLLCLHYCDFIDDRSSCQDFVSCKRSLFSIANQGIIIYTQLSWLRIRQVPCVTNASAHLYCDPVPTIRNVAIHPIVVLYVAYSV